MHIIDSHCHLDKVDLSAFGGSMDTLLAHAAQLDVKQFLCVCGQGFSWSGSLSNHRKTCRIHNGHLG